ncbi:adenosylmethionine-8-amino-7-oxononanoate aminotransferase [Naematelia encephala]|uniref:Adenosylmethionine-8-amino-7-oxononanoate aminotransferase n=1 Tax=Naematelia encephala TaxID=71784 RepID=A0A1Y2APQ1_9TREE|nr:adenosylmethionine-8-amino-7-oxononanoate aminotransferase [Naematelia encephala]
MAPISLADLATGPVSPSDTVKALKSYTKHPNLLHSLPFPIAKDGKPNAVHSKGIYWYLEDGSVLMDAGSSGVAVTCIGMGIPEVFDAIDKQMRKTAFVYHAYLSCPPAAELADYLLAKSDGAFQKATFFCSGSEAIEAALKLSFNYWRNKGQPQRRHFISREYSYHGNTFGAMQLGDSARSHFYRPLWEESSTFHKVSSGGYLRDKREGETEEEFSERMSQELEAKILSLGPDTVMAFCAETVNGGIMAAVAPPKGYFPAISRVLKKYDILLVMDEVLCGMGRVGTLHAWQTVGEGVRPDIQPIAKGLGGGYMPISGVLVNHKVSEVLGEGMVHAHTYQEHPVACAAALAVQKYVFDHDLLANNRLRGAQLLTLLKEGLDHLEYVRDVRGTGCLLGIEFEPFYFNPKAKPRFAPRLSAAGRINGVLLTNLSGNQDFNYGEGCYLAPAFTLTEDETNLMAELVIKSIKDAHQSYIDDYPKTV